MMQEPLTAGELIRYWRARRRLSQLELALDADVSTRHLSCLENGRAAPSREMILRLARRLDVPLRERNRLLTAAGYAPMFAARPLDDPAALDLSKRTTHPGPQNPRDPDVLVEAILAAVPHSNNEQRTTSNE